MNIVVLSASPERQKVVQAPWEIVSRVGIDSLEQAEDDPDVDCQDVQVLGEVAPKKRPPNGAKAKSHNFDR